MTPPASRERQARVGAGLVAALAAVALGLTATRVPPLPGAGRPAPDMRLDPARDPLAALDALPGVGPHTARALQDTAAAAPFRDGRDLRRARGVGPVIAARIAPHVRLPDAPLEPSGSPPSARR